MTWQISKINWKKENINGKEIYLYKDKFIISKILTGYFLEVCLPNEDKWDWFGVSTLEQAKQKAEDLLSV